jgi:superfamily II DNA or RNA helicase
MNSRHNQRPEPSRRTAIQGSTRAEKRTKPRKPPTHRVRLPRQGKLKKMIEVLLHMVQGKNPTQVAAAVNLDPNIVGYHRNNARLLALLDAQDRITPEGKALLQLEPEFRLGRLYYAFEASEVGGLWCQWAGVKTLAELAPNSAEEFLRQHCAKKGLPYNTTMEAHEQALRNWCEDLQEGHRQLHLPAAARLAVFGPPPEQVVFNSGGSREIVRALAVGSSRVSVATGYFDINGYRELADNLHYCDLRLLIGSDDRSRDQIKELLRRFRHDIIRTHEMSMAEKRSAVQEFHLTTIRGNIRIRSLEARERARLHAKVYIFDRDAAFVTSANLSGRGLSKNVEAGAVLCEKDKVDYLQRCFDDYFAQANPIEELILREIERSSLMLGLQDPKLVFLKILHELFGSVEELDSQQHYHLAEYQKAIVSAVLARLDEQRRLLLIAPTGIGKTVMTAYAAKVLLERRQIDRVILVCKNPAMRDNWTRTLRSFQITPEIIRVFDLERETLRPVARPTDEEIHQIFRDLRPNDLVIVDECHHFRNRITARSQSLRTFLSGPESPPYALLLTATPLSTGIKNINAQLELISDEELTAVDDLATSHYALSVPLSSILQWFGEEAANQQRALKHGDGYLYFPTLITKIKRYHSALVPVFEALLGHRGELAEIKVEDTELRGWTDLTAADELEPDRLSAGFLVTLLARLAESSAAAFTTCIDGLLARAAKGELPGRDPNAVAQALQSLRALAPSKGVDPKLAALFKIIDDNDPHEKILIFSEYVATVEHLHKRLDERYKDRKIAGLTGKINPDERRRILRRFAPAAQKAEPPEAAKKIDILVASDAISEGENLQDASIVINYDLPWTPLRLIQRVGRIDRFTEHARKIRAFNLFPEGEEYEQIVRLWERLKSRDTDTSAISGYSTVAEHERCPDAIESGSTSAWLKKIAAAELDLAELRADPPNAFPHTRLLDRLWGATQQEREAAADLPDGVQAATPGATPGLYLLLRVDDKPVSFFRPDGSDNVEEAPASHPHEHFLHPLAAGPLVQAKICGNLDAEIDALLDLRFPDGRPDHCHLIAALKIVGAKNAPPTPRPAPPSKPKPPEQLAFMKLFDSAED